MKKRFIAIAGAFLMAAALSGCAAAADTAQQNELQNEIHSQLPEEQEPEIPAVTIPEPQPEPEIPAVVIPEPQPEPEIPAVVIPEPQPEPEIPAVTIPEPQPPKAKTVSYICVNADSVSLRSGAGTNYSSAGTAEKSTLYAMLGEEGGWYKTKYKNKTVYISKKYCSIVNMTKSDNEKIEAIIAEGANLLGTPYVYGATRCHDGNGNKLKGFTTSAFDCSSLMQYMFYKGADFSLQVNTRTQIYQGTTVKKSELKRGDLIFFTNADRRNKSGIERVGHVAMYLGDNYILHTASDYAKIEQISSLRWSYYIQSQRMI